MGARALARSLAKSMSIANSAGPVGGGGGGADTLPCYLVNNLTKDTEVQCNFVIHNDCLEKDGIFDYVYLVYCDIGYEFRYAAIGLTLFFVLILFLNLSSVADEFLCPSLLTVAKNLRMSDSLAVSLRA